MANNLPEKGKKFHCELCKFVCCKKYNYEMHLSTTKHKALVNPTEKKEKKCLKCPQCEKIYKHSSTLCAHKKTCSKNKKENIKIKITPKPDDDDKNVTLDKLTNMVCEMFKSNNILQTQNQEFKTMIVELVQSNAALQTQMLEVCKSNQPINQHNTINSNNKTTTFNMQVFLNETCKDAMNLKEFVDSIQLTLADFEMVGEKGIVDGLSNIIIKSLRATDMCLRPIHCSDLKREVIHIKDNNTWVKDEDKKHMKRAIKLIEHKNIKLVPGWLKANPKADDISTKKHEEYMKILDNSMGEMKDEDNERNYEKIIKNVAKEILIDKEK
jgi:hypothetical protein